VEREGFSGDREKEYKARERERANCMQGAGGWSDGRPDKILKLKPQIMAGKGREAARSFRLSVNVPRAL